MDTEDVVVYGGLGLLAYLLFFKKKPVTTTTLPTTATVLPASTTIPSGNATASILSSLATLTPTIVKAFQGNTGSTAANNTGTFTPQTPLSAILDNSVDTPSLPTSLPGASSLTTGSPALLTSTLPDPDSSGSDIFSLMESPDFSSAITGCNSVGRHTAAKLGLY